MRIHPELQHQDGVVSVSLKVQFVGDLTDADDRARIFAHGDPLINLGGQFSAQAGDPPPVYKTGASELWVGLTRQMPGKVIRFMRALPEPTLGQSAPGQGPLDVIAQDPVAAATIYVAAIQARIASALATLRAKTPVQLTSLPDTTV